MTFGKKRKPDLFDAAAAREARDEGMEKVEENDQEWMLSAMMAGRSLPRGWEGTGEDIRVALTMGGLPKPHHHNCWGAFINSMVREGWLEWTSAMRNMRTVKSHARATKVYRKVR